MLQGDPAAWLAQFKPLEQRLSEAIDQVWPVCIGPLKPLKSTMTHEDHITCHLVAALIRSKKVPGRIIPQYSLLTEKSDQTIHLSSNIDFVLTIGDDENVYLACECKRLNVPFKSGLKGLVGEYVDEGLMRFITGQYSNGLPLAMMLGYVMNARHDRARKGLRNAMKVRSQKIGLKNTVDVPVVAGKPIRFVTSHTCQTGHDIDVSHTLLAWP